MNEGGAPATCWICGPTIMAFVILLVLLLIAFAIVRYFWRDPNLRVGGAVALVLIVLYVYGSTHSHPRTEATRADEGSVVQQKCHAFEQGARAEALISIDHVRCWAEGKDGDQYAAQVFVSSSGWAKQTYKQRVQTVKALGELWIKYSRPDNPDAVSFMVMSDVVGPNHTWRQFGAYNRDPEYGVWLTPFGMVGVRCPHALVDGGC